ncbi:hypothetical protein ACFUAC_16905 [Streptomyces sp. NPDC057148]|uniref:hypothetical protein n=1 Tax=unclassified Streptomyces TaxID=2593676 RepID=UPI003631786A
MSITATKVIPATLAVLAWQVAAVALLVFGITQLDDAGPHGCDPALEKCVVMSGSGTPEDVAAEQTAEAATDAWLLILIGGTGSILLPASAVIAMIGGRRESRERLARRARLERIKQRRNRTDSTSAGDSASSPNP